MYLETLLSLVAFKESNLAQIRYCYLPLGLYCIYCVGLYSMYLHDVEKGEPMYSML